MMMMMVVVVLAILFDFHDKCQVVKVIHLDKMKIKPSINSILFDGTEVRGSDTK